MIKTWLHYAKEVLRKEDLRPAQQWAEHWQKPSGLWMTVEQDGEDQCWRSWCEQEGYRLHALKHVHEIDVNMTHMLVLDTPEAVIRFDDKYTQDKRRHFIIDWTRVAEDFAGIFIVPYQWNLRMSMINWYYSWDCSSGCVWDTSHIRDVRLRLPVNREENAA